MSRPLRIQYPGAMYHITSRGNGGNKIFKDKGDYLIFLEELKKVIEDYNWISYAYCLMPNHYHLFIKTIDPNLSIGMRQLNGDYTQKYNIRHKQFGHIFQGRFKSILVEDAGYQGVLVRYITLNPVKAKLVKSPMDWPWSSHQEIMGLKKGSGCVHVSETLSFFHNNKALAKKEYNNYLYEKIDSKETWNDLRSGLILGSLQFAREVVEKYGNKESVENVKRERFAGRPTLEEIFKERKGIADRNSLIHKSFKKYGYTQTEIGGYLNLHYSTISRIVDKAVNNKNGK
jgi:REP element-mobilizing transposase RayT